MRVDPPAPVGEDAPVPRRLMTAEEILSVLGETPARLSGLSAAADPAQLRAAPEPGAWSATGVLAHLRSCADVWGGAIGAILAEDHPTLTAINPTTWIDSTDYRELEFRPSLKAFTRQRADLLARVESLPPEAWERGATVVGAGRPLERTVHEYASRLARHERTHWKQVEKTIARVLAG